MSNKTKFLLLTALLCINPYLSAMDNKKPEIDTTPKKWFFQRLFNRSSATVAPATITSTISDPSKNVGTPGATSNVAPTPKVPTKPNSTPNETPKSQSTPNTPATNTQKSTTDLTHSLAGPEDLMHRQQASYLSRARNWLWSQERPQPKQELPASTTVTPPTPNPLVNVTNPDPTSKPKPTPNAPTNQNSTPNETPKPQSKLNTPAPKPSTPSDQKPNTNSGWSFGSVDINPDKIRQDRHDGRPRGRSSDHDIKPKEIIPPIDPEIEKSRKAFGHDGFRNLIPEPLEQSPSPSTATSNKNPASTAVPSNTNPSKNNTTPPNDSTPNNTEIPKVKTNDNSSDLDWSFGYKKKDPTTAPPSTAWNVSSYVARSLATSLIMDIFFNDENERIESWNAFVREYEAKLKKEAEERAAQKIELAKQERIQLDDLLQQASQLQEIEFTNDKLSKKAKLERAVRQEKKQRDASYVFDARCRVRDSWQNFKQNVSNIWDNGIINTLNNGKGGYWHQSRFAIPSQRIFINSYFAQEMFEAAFKKDPIISPAIFKKIVCNREKVQENLIQTQKAFNELNQQGILDDNDQEIVQALERAVSERGAPIHKNYNQLTSEAKKLLADCGVDPKNFEGMVGNALQVHLFDRTNDVINELAKMDPKYLGDHQTHEYLQAALDSCADTVYTIKNGTPQEAVAMAKLAETFHQCLRVSYGITKGISYGLKNVVQDTIERGVLPQPVMIAKNLAQTFQLIAALGSCENKGEAIAKAYDEFRQLPLEKQAEHITTIIATFLIPVPGKISSGIVSANKTLANIAKIARREAVGLQLLCKVEGSTLKPGQILSGVRASQAPFMAGCQSAIKTVSKGIKAPNIIGKAKDKITAATQSQVSITKKAALEILSNSKELQIIEKNVEQLKHVVKDQKFGLIDTRVTNVLKYEKAFSEAEKHYDSIRAVTNDIELIAKNTKISDTIIKKIKEHIFFEDHILHNGIKRFEANPDIADAWQRLTKGNFVQSDLKLLQHEYAESLIMQGKRVAYDPAHYILNAIEKYNWQDFC